MESTLGEVMRAWFNEDKAPDDQEEVEAILDMPLSALREQLRQGAEVSKCRPDMNGGVWSGDRLFDDPRSLLVWLQWQSAGIVPMGEAPP